MILNRLLLILFILFFSYINANANIVIQEPSGITFPSKFSFTVNSEYLKTMDYKKITAVEYVTDPLILYTYLWLVIGSSFALWDNYGFITPPNGNLVFADRMKMEPFATGRYAPITKVDQWGNTILSGEFYAKNFIEPIYFTYIGLYLNAKNYHPAIMITEMFLLSVLYEFTIRPFFMNANFEQLLKNPALGILFSLIFDELATFLLTTNNKALHIFAYILNPFKLLPTARIHGLLFFDPFKQKASIEGIIKLD